MTGPRPLEADDSGGAGLAWRDLADLWRRVYVLCMILYAPAAIAVLGWLIWSGAGAMTVLAWALLMVPAGFGVAFVVSIPLTALWSAGAWAAGWHAPKESNLPQPRPCPRCGYDSARIKGDRCPECGLEIDREGDVEEGR